MKNKELTDLYSILTAGGRNGGEQSRALPQRAYRNPADVVEFPAELARRKKAKKLKQQKQPKYKLKYRGK